jgi:glycosyltransferase involved in cell wall biosynthesis
MKSAIKWMEYSMVGMATVAANIPPYSKVISNGNTGILCNEDEKEWVDAIERLISSKSTRYAMACEAKAEVLANHNIKTKAHLWRDAYDAILKPKSGMIK